MQGSSANNDLRRSPRAGDARPEWDSFPTSSVKGRSEEPSPLPPNNDPRRSPYPGDARPKWDSFPPSPVRERSEEPPSHQPDDGLRRSPHPGDARPGHAPPFRFPQMREGRRPLPPHPTLNLVILSVPERHGHNRSHPRGMTPTFHRPASRGRIASA
jgi:hypothetical protein